MPEAATKRIIERYNLPIKKGTIIFDSLMFRVKILKVLDNFNQRKFIFLSCLMSNVLKSNLVILINSTYFQNVKKSLQDWNMILPSAMDF